MRGHGWLEQGALNDAAFCVECFQGRTHSLQGTRKAKHLQALLTPSKTTNSHCHHALFVFVQAVCAPGNPCTADCVCPSDTSRCDSGVCKLLCNPNACTSDCSCPGDKPVCDSDNKCKASPELQNAQLEGQSLVTAASGPDADCRALQHLLIREHQSTILPGGMGASIGKNR